MSKKKRAGMIWRRGLEQKIQEVGDYRVGDVLGIELMADLMES